MQAAAQAVRMRGGSVPRPVCYIIHGYLEPGTVRAERQGVLFNYAAFYFGASPYRALLPDTAREVARDRTVEHDTAMAALERRLKQQRDQRMAIDASIDWF